MPDVTSTSKNKQVRNDTTLVKEEEIIGKPYAIGTEGTKSKVK